MPRARVRSGRSDAPGDGPVVVLGSGPVAAAVAAGLGERARLLERLPDTEPERALADASAVVLVAHGGDLAATLALDARTRRADAVASAQRTVSAVRAAHVPHLVAITSAMVHGAWADRPVVQDAEPLAHMVDLGEGPVGDLLAVEAVLARSGRRTRPLLTVLRPAALVGAGVDTLVTRHFEAPRLLVVRGVERSWQLLHVEDLAAAVAVVLEHGLVGGLTVGAGDVLTAAQVQRAAGMRRIELAAVTAFGTAERLHRVGALPTPAAELAYVVYPWTVDPAGLTAAGWEPRWSSEAALSVLLQGVQGRLALGGRRVGSRDAAALGAAGAAVALIGTAAVLRQARSRRRG